jgi:hypothetical protein
MTQNVYPPTPELADANVIDRREEVEGDHQQEYHDTTSASGVRPNVIIHEGEPVFTADNKKIGTVKEVGTQFFKVHATLRKDYWLDQNLIVSCDQEELRLNVSKDDLEAFKLDHPAVEDALLPTEEQLRQRRLMEQELAVQSAELEAEQEATGTPIVYNEAGDRIAAVDTQMDGDASMAELRDTERGPDPQFAPDKFSSEGDVNASRQSREYDAAPAAAVGLDQDMDTSRVETGRTRSSSMDTGRTPGSTMDDGRMDDGRMATNTNRLERPSMAQGTGRTEALRTYADQLRNELRYVESELNGGSGIEGSRRA